MKSKSLILMIVSLGFGLIAAIGISQVMGKSKGEAAPEIQMGPVVVALIELKHGEELTEENCKIENWPADIIPENACRGLEEIKSMAIRNRLSKSLPIMRSDILKASEIGVVKIPAGFKVVAIKVGADDTMSGLLQPGHHVDVIGVVNVKDEETGNSKTISETFLRNVEVFSVNDKTRIRSAGENGSSGSTVVGVLLKEQQAEQLVWIQKVARLKLVLRGDDASDEEGGHLDQEKFDSIFGIVNKDMQNNGTKTVRSDDGENFETRVITGTTFETIKFVDGERSGGEVTELQADMGGSSTKTDSDDSDDFEGGLEEDQYPGE